MSREGGGAEGPLEPSFRPFDAILVWYFGTIALLVLLFRSDVPDAGLRFGLHAGGAVAALLAPFVFRRLPASQALLARAAVGSVLLPVAFQALGGLVEFVSPDDREWFLISLDRRLFGTDPTRALGTLANPALTEALQWVYASFYFLPIPLGVSLARSRNWRAFEFSLAAVTLGFVLSYLGYFLVPARGPERYLPHGEPLAGMWAAATLREWIARLEGVKRDLFPSGHTEISVLVAALAWKFRSPAFRFLAPVAVALVFSTVYLRYHYAVDLLGGVALAAGVLWLTARLHRPVAGG